MAANVLNTQRAIEASVHVVRAFVRLREMIASNKELSRRLDELEKKYDSQFKVVFDAIRQLIMPSVFTRPPRGCQDSLFSRCRRATGSGSAGKNRNDNGRF